MIKALDIRNSKVSYLAFLSNTILSCFFLFFLVIHLHSLIPEVILQILNTAAKLAIPTGILTYEVNSETETKPQRAEAKTRKYSK